MNRTWAAAAPPSVNGGPGFGFHLTASAESSAAWRLVTLRLGKRFPFPFGSNHVANPSQHLNPRRQEIAITIDDRGKLLYEKDSLFVGQFQVHTLRYGMAIR